MKYREDMSPEDAALLLSEIEELEASYEGAHSNDLVPASEEDKEFARALIEQSLDYFNRYIAGDR